MSTSTDSADVVIVGGGVAGLGLACALSRYQLDVVVIEKRAKTGGIHRGDSLLPKTNQILDSWGVLDAIWKADVQPIDHIEVHHGHGKIFQRSLALPTERYPYLVLPHAKIEEVLIQESLRFGHTTVIRPAGVTDVIVDSSGRACGVHYKTESGKRQIRARLVVACDGQRSTVRGQIGIPLESYPYDHAYLGLEADRPVSYENAMRVHLHSAGSVLLMPRSKRVGIGVLIDADAGRAWLKMGEDALSKALIERAPILAGMKMYAQGARVYSLTRSHAKRYYSSGAAIIGDAAHCVNPASGHGMAMALGDAARLADTVGPALERGERDLSAPLASYQATQWAHNDRLVRSTHRLALFYALRGHGWDRFKVALFRTLGSPMGDRAVRSLLRTFLKSDAA